MGRSTRSGSDCGGLLGGGEGCKGLDDVRGGGRRNDYCWFMSKWLTLAVLVLCVCSE